MLYQQNQNKCWTEIPANRFLFVPWSQSAPSSAKKGDNHFY
jgi:hypothetical protein